MIEKQQMQIKELKTKLKEVLSEQCDCKLKEVDEEKKVNAHEKVLDLELKSDMRKKLAEGGESSLGKVISNLHRQIKQLKQEKVALEAQLIKSGSFSLPYTTDSNKLIERVNCGLSEKSIKVAK